MGRPLALLFVACFAVIARPGRAASVIPHIVRGDTFTVKDSSGGADPAGRNLTVVAKEPQTSDQIVGEPDQNGALIEIIANGAHPSTQSFVLPGSGLPGRKVTTTGRAAEKIDGCSIQAENMRSVYADYHPLSGVGSGSADTRAARPSEDGRRSS